MINETELILNIKNWQQNIHDNEYNAKKYDFVFERIYKIINETSRVNEWHPASEIPKANGEYLCQIRITDDYAVTRVLKYSDDLYSVDDYDFYEYKGKKVGGFYGCDSEYGYYEVSWVEAWKETPTEYKPIK